MSEHSRPRSSPWPSDTPVVTLTGPRQSGKTTLCRAAFPDKPYLSLEPPDEREFARTIHAGFLPGFPDGAIVDEVQRALELLSYIQQIDLVRHVRRD